MAVAKMKLKPDATLRRRFMVPESFQHPAKGHLGLWWEILERYTQPDQWVLDPMAGIGSTLLGCLMGRNVICVELEPHFVAPMKASWAKMRQSPMLGCELGQALIIRGDARALPLRRVDVVVASPPYEGSSVGNDTDSSHRQWERFQKVLVSGNVAETTKERWKPGQPPAASNNLVLPRYTRPVDAVVTSPPYEEHHQGGADRAPERMQGSQNGLPSRRYVDAVVTSANVAECYNIDTCQLQIELSRKRTGKPLAEANGLNVLLAGQTGPVFPDRDINNAVWIVGLQLTEGLSDATSAPTGKLPLLKEDSLRVKRLNDVLERSILSTKGCWGSNTPQSPELRCPLHVSKAESLQPLLDAVLWGLPNGRHGELLSLSEMAIPVAIVGLSPSQESTCISIPITSSILRSTLSSLLKSAMDSHCVNPATIKSMASSPAANIGNLRGSTYWSEISKVYRECHRVLKPGGLMVLVVKGYTRDREYVDLPQQTVECCEALGFRFVERWERELWNLSFWRTLQARQGNLDDRLRRESVLVLKKT